MQRFERRKVSCLQLFILTFTCHYILFKERKHVQKNSVSEVAVNQLKCCERLPKSQYALGFVYCPKHATDMVKRKKYIKL